MSLQLARIFQQKARKEHFEVVKSLTSCTIKVVGFVCGHIEQIKSYIGGLEIHDVFFDKKLVVDLVLGFLPSSYNNFIMTYYFNSEDKILMKLYNLLQPEKVGLKKPTINSKALVLAIQKWWKEEETFQSQLESVTSHFSYSIFNF